MGKISELYTVAYLSTSAYLLIKEYFLPLLLLQHGDVYRKPTCGFTITLLLVSKLLEGGRMYYDIFSGVLIRLLIACIFFEVYLNILNRE